VIAAATSILSRVVGVEGASNYDTGLTLQQQQYWQAADGADSNLQRYLSVFISKTASHLGAGVTLYQQQQQATPAADGGATAATYMPTAFDLSMNVHNSAMNAHNSATWQQP
jgi:hypothetical protein